MDALYTAIAHASGGGRDGHVRTEDDRLDLDTRAPEELGGSGEGTNPEQLFAAGYSACFLSALHGAGRQLKIDTTDAAVSASVSIGKNDSGGFGLSVELDVYVPKASAEEAQNVADAAHQLCPYSNATRGNIPVQINLVD
ncbi:MULTISPECIES: organic hydroperoxide resistance protein [Rathayibacter]|uniref:Organic hydroperoxide resistance protein n=2 Tax=Rathayibacter iranicus TaxID=59737 RepID=A0AAD1AEM5_9MICO|nr:MULTISPECIES: organic hydroperoxide resistance protein [Rathayibacter]AZZ56738.1 organic hydroperoxide resistance protein [Rathayibacter iranicus]MWV31216.1 Ohr family peroxiredoxin [Rathayibacter iranicus NCPPB 2253 = VKM Ac-1602]NRD09039.1 organic hydroperoxide resistance protein [Rathayibacter agropyri]PPI43079.1 organic hydroperoxide resistance protein [Rathayibacter iranicus]PPI58329.1 organic hydroperoxide resistance protein [Rathayibacter iranicus]